MLEQKQKYLNLDTFKKMTSNILYIYKNVNISHHGENKVYLSYLCHNTFWYQQYMLNCYSSN